MMRRSAPAGPATMCYMHARILSCTVDEEVRGIVTRKARRALCIIRRQSQATAWDTLPEKAKAVSLIKLTICKRRYSASIMYACCLDASDVHSSTEAAAASARYTSGIDTPSTSSV